MSNTIKTVLLLGNYRPSITLARTLKKRGFEVVVGSHGCERGCQYSNAVSRIWDHSPLSENGDVFASELREFSRSNPDLLAIFVVAEEYVRLIAENEGRFSEFTNLVTMPAGLVNKCLDKPYMMQLAAENNVPTAPNSHTSNQEEFARAVKKIGTPLILRLRDSTQRLGGKKALILEDAQSLGEANEELKFDRQDLLIQQKFEGLRHNIYFAASGGRLVRCLHAVITRTDSVDDTGLAVEGITLEPSGELIEQTKRLLKALNYEGIGCAQYLVNPDNGNSSFLEINPRIAGNHALPEYAGLALGDYMLDLMVGKLPDQRPIMSRAGIRYCWTSGDLMGLKVAYLRSEINLSEAILWFAKAIGAGFRADVHMVFNRHDPVPALRALWNIFPRIARWKTPVVNPGENTICQDTNRKPI
ncbi:MAG: hypothetical protein L3J32_03385 [Rhizobiaceae bacterium]|nr:hypothetical protein [Rhizobiaceae bacterium]